MSKPLNTEFFIELDTPVINRKSEVLLQVLDLLETLKSNQNEKMARISSELTELLENEENLEKNYEGSKFRRAFGYFSCFK